MVQNIVSTLGAGSGIDIQTLAKDLVEAERAPKKAQIESRIERSDARVSGYAALRFALSELRDAFAALDDRRDFASVQASSSQSSAVRALAGAGAAAGSYAIVVEQLASAQRLASSGFAKASTALNGGAPFNLQLAINGGVPTAITVVDDTPAGVVEAINAAGLGVQAELVNVGGADPYRVVLTGEPGAARAFTVTAPPGTIAFDSMLQAAADAWLSLDGLSVTRPTNRIDDLLPGVTLELSALTQGSARLELVRNVSGVRAKIEALVKAYNGFEETVGILADRASDIERFGGALAGDSLLQGIRAQVRGLFAGMSSTPGAQVKALRDLGIAIDRDGILQIDGGRLDSALSERFDQVAQMFSADTDNQNLLGTGPAGLAGDAVRSLRTMLRADGLIARQSQNAIQSIERERQRLEALESRMDQLLERYVRQFSLMESIVGESTRLRGSLESSFEGLMAMYTRR